MRSRLAHAIALSATLILSSSDAEAVDTPPETTTLHVAASPGTFRLGAIVPFESRARVNLEAVWWTAPHDEPVGRLAKRFGVDEDDLRALDPALAGDRVEAGQKVLVFRHEPDTVSRSIGAPNRGRLEHGAAFPEGEAWNLRAYRPRAWATRHVVTQLAAALHGWREDHPEAQPVLLGELSRRGGGRARPHRSHRSGRDVDLGYVLLQPPAAHRFTRATLETLDAAATWDLVQRLLATESVESIYITADVQVQLLPFAIPRVDPSQLPAVFSVLATDVRDQKKALIRHVRGHDDHMHIRFSCTQADLGCKEAKRRRSKKRRRGKKKRRSRRRR